MKKRSLKTIFLAIALAGMVGPWVLPQQVYAQDAVEDYTKDEDYEIGSLFMKSTDAMGEEEWDKALFYLNRIIDEYGVEGTVEEFGPKFGVMHYRKAFCLKNKQDFEGALAAYKVCTEQFANKPDTPAEMKNPLVANAILESAGIKQRQGKFDEAVALYETFQSRAAEAPDGSFSKVGFFIQAGSAYIEAGQTDKGMEIITRAFDQGAQLGAKNRDLFTGFLSVIDGWTSAGGDPVATQKTAHQFIDKYESSLVVTPYDKYQRKFDPQLVEAARSCSMKGMHTLALRLYAMVSSPSDFLEYLEARGDQLGGISPKLQEAMDDAKKQAADPEGYDFASLFGVANTYQQLGNYRAAFVVYDYMESAYPESPHRADILFGAFQTSAAIGQDEAAVYFGDTLLTQFPDYNQRDKAIGLFVTKLFFSGDYEQALERATGMRADVLPGTPEKEIVDFVIPGSLFYLGRYDESIPEIGTFIETYPESSYLDTMHRLDGLGAVIKQDWPNAAKKLDYFIEKYPDSKMLEDVLVDRAVTHYSMNEYPETLAVVQKLRTEHAGCANIDRALNLAGDVYSSYDEPNVAKAEEAYIKAREAADRREHADPHAHATAQLVSILGPVEGKSADIVGYYDEFFAKHEGHWRAPQVAVAGIEALRANGRIADGLTNLEKVIVRTANSDTVGDSDDLERGMGSYVQFYTEENGAKKMEQQLLDFPTHGMPKPPLLKAWLIMSRIDLVEDPANKDAFANPEATSKVAYGELREFDKSILPPYILVKVGRQLRSKGNPLEAVPWFEEVLKRGEGEFTGGADLGMAQIYAASGDPSKETEALAKFATVAENYKGQKYEEEALVGRAHLLFKQGNWNEAATAYQTIFENKGWKKDRVLIAFNMAQAFEKAGDTKMALYALTQFFAPPYQGQVQYSVEARLKAAEIQYAAGKKQKAYDLIKLTVQQMHKFRTHPIAGPHMIRALKLYKQWQVELGLPADELAEEGIEF